MSHEQLCLARGRQGVSKGGRGQIRAGAEHGRGQEWAGSQAGAGKGPELIDNQGRMGAIVGKKPQNSP